MKKIVIAALLLLIAATAFAAGRSALPKGYEKWEKSKQKIVTDKSSLFYGVHYIYADPKAMQGYKSGGKSFPEGSRFVIDYFKIKEVGGKPTEGKKNMIVLMRKDKRFNETGGWEFAGFTADGKPSGLDPVKICFECHVKEAKDRDYVISRYSDFH